MPELGRRSGYRERNLVRRPGCASRKKDLEAKPAKSFDARRIHGQGRAAPGEHVAREERGSVEIQYFRQRIGRGLPRPFGHCTLAVENSGLTFSTESKLST